MFLLESPVVVLLSGEVFHMFAEEKGIRSPRCQTKPEFNKQENLRDFEKRRGEITASGVGR